MNMTRICIDGWSKIKKPYFSVHVISSDYIQGFSVMSDSCISVVREINLVKYIFLSTLQNKDIQKRDRVGSETVPVKWAL